MKQILEKVFQNSFFRDSFWALLGSVILRGSALVSSIMLAHILLKTTFGEFNSLKNTLTTLAVFTTFGLGYTSTKFVADFLHSKKTNLRKLVNQIYRITITFSGVISLLLFVFSANVSSFYYKNSEFSNEIKLLAVWVVLTAISTSQNGIIGGLGIFKKLSLINVVMGIITIILLPVLSYTNGLIGACIALLLIQFVNSILNYILIQKELKIIESNSESANAGDIEYKDILLFSVPLTLIEAFFSIFLWLNYFLLQNYQNYDEVAIYSAAMQWYVVLLFIPTVLRNVILSYFSRNESGSRSSVLKNAVLISIITTLIPAAIVFFMAPWVSQMYGKTFSELTLVLRIIVFIPVFSSIINVLEQFLFSVSKNWLVFIICFIKDSFTFLIFAYLVFFWNIKEGAIYLTSSSLFMNFLAAVVYLVIYLRTDIFTQYMKLKNI